ncbi:cystatin-B-like [Stegostoma tigrinum]|uniref:cystatin-B-like n=1 Tax=Stegostoma tigrinum TaxID=3053191 RepID=UPI0028702B22|nr:cystatin-B-like [Stegostoma tigrinum]
MEQGQCIVGGYDAVQAVTEEVQDLAQKVKLQVEKKVCRKFETYHAISYCSQVVAGTNLSIKIVVGPGDDYIHVDVYKPLPCSGEQPFLLSSPKFHPQCFTYSTAVASQNVE